MADRRLIAGAFLGDDCLNDVLYRLERTRPVHPRLRIRGRMDACCAATLAQIGHAPFGPLSIGDRTNVVSGRTADRAPPAPKVDRTIAIAGWALQLLAGPLPLSF
jgi:hypothetical protein